MFPYVHHRPAQLGELLIFTPVPINIPLEFFSPPIAVVFWHDKMLGTRMPEAAVHKDRYSSRSEDNIWPAREISVIYSESKTTTVQLSAYQRFWSRGGCAHLLHLPRYSLAKGGRPLSPRSASQFLPLLTSFSVGEGLSGFPTHEGLITS